MELVYFRDTLEDNAEAQYGILMDGDSPSVICLCCGGVLEHGDYEIIKRHPWRDLSGLIKESAQSKYVVCMDTVYVRDAQFLDTKGLSQDEFDEFDYYSSENDGLWIDIEPTPFVAIVEADSEDSACTTAAKQAQFDRRCLFATKI